MCYFIEEDRSNPEAPFVVKFDARDGYPRLFDRYTEKQDAAAAVHYLNGGALHSFLPRAA